MSIFPLEYYNKIYHYFILFIVIIVFFKSFIEKQNNPNAIKSNNFIGNFLLISILLYMGLRPISFKFGDMGIYAMQFDALKSGESPLYEKDILFDFVMLFFAKIGSAELFFFFCAVLYLIPLYIISKKIFNDYWFYSFLILVASMSFWSYGTNGIRNGFATSLFLLAICQRKAVTKFLILFLILFLHKSLIIPVLAYFASTFYKNNKTYFLFWILAIPVSLALGSVLESFFLNLGFGEKDQLEGYLGNYDNESEGVVAVVGFRWDFLIYSSISVFTAWFFIYKKKFKDDFYLQLVNIYLFSNAFWILVIRANYSNRFAYLSWFMMGLVIIYPLLKVNVFKNQNQLIGSIILFYFIFTFIFNVVMVQ